MLFDEREVVVELELGYLGADAGNVRDRLLAAIVSFALDR